MSARLATSMEQRISQASTATSVFAFGLFTGIEVGNIEVPSWTPSTLLWIGGLAGLAALILWVRVVYTAFSTATPQAKRIVGVTLAALAVLGLAYAGGIYTGRSTVQPPIVIDPAEVERLQQALSVSQQETEAERTKNGALTAILEREMGASQAQAAIATEAPPTPLGPLSLRTVIGVTQENYTQTMASRRRELGLRELSPETEEGRPLSAMPTGSYAFVYPGALNTSDDAGLNPVFLRQESTPDRGSYAEVRRLANDEYYLVAFISEDALPSVNGLTGIDPRPIDTFFRPTASRSVLVEIPVARIVSADSRDAAGQIAVEFVIR